MARRKRKSKNRKDGGHRQAPRPASWNCPRGTCRFCGDDIIENGKQNKRKHWHQACADIQVRDGLLQLHEDFTYCSA